MKKLFSIALAVFLMSSLVAIAQEPIRFTANGELMPLNEGAHLLCVDGNPNTIYNIDFGQETVIESEEIFGLYLTGYIGPTEAELLAYYDDKPELWSNYLKNATVGNNPFAYIDGPNGNLLDGAVYYISEEKVPMRIPGDYPLGEYTVEDMNSQASYVGFNLRVSDCGTNEEVPEFGLIGAAAALAGAGLFVFYKRRK